MEPKLTFDFGLVYKNHEKQYKSEPEAIGTKKRLEKNIKYRKSVRSTVFDNDRDLSRSNSPVPPTELNDVQLKVEHRKQMLEKWKKEKEEKKRQTAAKKKQPFHAGVVPATLKYVPPPPPPKPVPSLTGRVTRSRVLRQEPEPFSFAPKNATFKPPKLKNLKTIPKLVLPPKNTKSYTFDPVIPKNMAKKETKTIKVQKKETKPTIKTVANKIDKNPVKSKAKVATVAKEDNGRKRTLRSTKVEAPKLKTIEIEIEKPKSVKKSNRLRRSNAITESMDLEKENSPTPEVINPEPIRSSRKTPRKSLGALDHNTPRNLVPKSESNSEEKLRSPKDVRTPFKDAQNSPFVTLSRGKDRARKEMKKKLEEAPEMMCDEEDDHSDGVNHFRQLLSQEIDRINAMCDAWDQIYEETTLEEFVQELVLAAVGQARLLVAQKFRQFASLVERCASEDHSMGKVTTFDLQGFWDMLYLQVENINMRFKQLDELRARNWAKEEPKVVKKKSTKAPAKKAAKPSGGPSRIREMIAAARKAKKDQESQSSDANTSASTTSEEETKAFDGGFFSVTSPVKSPLLPSTPLNKSNLLKNVLSSEARKASATKMSTSLIMVHASSIGKGVEIEGIAPLELTPEKFTHIDFDATPAKSILKSGKKGSRRSRKVKSVLFTADGADDAETPSGAPVSSQRITRAMARLSQTPCQ